MSLQQACAVLGIFEDADYYEWRKRPASPRAIRHAWLTDQITQIHVESRGIKGAQRVRAELVLGRGVLVGHNAVAMLMHRAGLKGMPNRRIRSDRPGLAVL